MCKLLKVCTNLWSSGCGEVMSFFAGLFSLTLARERPVLYGFLFVFLTCSLIILSSRLDMRQETVLVQQLAELQTEVMVLDASNKIREKEVELLSQHLGNLIANPLTTDTTKILADLKSVSHNMTTRPAETPPKVNESSQPMRLPSGYDFLPHLLQSKTSIEPAYVLSNGRKGVSVAMGIPTVKRYDQVYVIATLQNLLDAMSKEEKDDSIIIVFIAETIEEYILHIANTIKRDFESHLDSGLIEVIAPAPSYYPDLSKLEANLGDSLDRFRWRTKQNLDFAYLMMYSHQRSTYYVQLEDDIDVKPNFVTTMKTMAQEKSAKAEPWFVLDFCELVFIGKLFKSIDLPIFAQYLLMLYNAKPVDWLLDDFLFAKVCRLGNSDIACRRAKNELWVNCKPSLFQHVGIQSSLKGKLQLLKDSQFGNVSLYFPHQNPEADVTSQVKAYKHYTLQRAYAGNTFFWGLIPEADNHLNFKFKKPLFIKRFLFRSGNAEHPSDKFYDTTVEVLPVNPRPKAEKITKDGFIVVGEFNLKGVAEGSLGREYGAIKELRLNIHSDGGNWSILSEIHIEPEDTT